jgi:sortase A
LGQGAYIPAKAWLAQELMQRAWTRGTNGSAQPVPWPWGRTLAFGPGHLSASSLPGEIGNTVIAGHRDTHFRFLRDVEVGELLVIESVSGEKHLYEIFDIDVVDSRRSSLLLDTDTAILSLVTCYPFEAIDPGGPMRYVVTAKMLF